jgi:hypothetical protein
MKEKKGMPKKLFVLLTVLLLSVAFVLVPSLIAERGNGSDNTNAL